MTIGHHGCHGHHGHQCHGGHGDHVGHGGRGEPGGRDGTGRICNVNTGDVAIDFINSTMSKDMKSVLPINCFKQGHPTSLHKMNSNLNATRKDHV